MQRFDVLPGLAGNRPAASTGGLIHEEDAGREAWGDPAAATRSETCAANYSKKEIELVDWFFKHFKKMQLKLFHSNETL